MDYTVLLPVYIKDKKEHFMEALESLLKQTIKPREILILVDGPIENDLKNIIECYNNKFEIIDVKYFSENRGLGKVLHDGVLLSKNELIGRMDADDISIENRFEKQIEYFNKDSSLALIGSNIREFDYDFKTELKERKVPTNYKEIKAFSKKRNPFNHMTVMFKKSDILEVGNYLDMTFFEDYYLWIRVINAEKNVANIDEVLVNVRAGQEMIIKRSGCNYMKKEIKFQETLLNMKYINRRIFIRNVFFRCLPRILPTSILDVIYGIVLRK